MSWSQQGPAAPGASPPGSRSRQRGIVAARPARTRSSTRIARPRAATSSWRQRRPAIVPSRRAHRARARRAVRRPSPAPPSGSLGNRRAVRPGAPSSRSPSAKAATAAARAGAAGRRTGIAPPSAETACWSPGRRATGGSPPVIQAPAAPTVPTAILAPWTSRRVVRRTAAASARGARSAPARRAIAAAPGGAATPIVTASPAVATASWRRGRPAIPLGPAPRSAPTTAIAAPRSGSSEIPVPAPPPARTPPSPPAPPGLPTVAVRAGARASQTSIAAAHQRPRALESRVPPLPAALTGAGR
jgi:hypothetical protein